MGGHGQAGGGGPAPPPPPHSLQGSPSMIDGHTWILFFVLVFTHSPPPSSHGAFISTDQAFKTRHVCRHMHPRTEDTLLPHASESRTGVLGRSAPL